MTEMDVSIGFKKKNCKGDMMNFHERLKELRQDNQKTQKELADFLGITERSYQRYEAGDREPDIRGLNKLADYYKVTVDYLLGRTDKK